ncbi:hypothetical protein GmHk_08G023628 [Glycine max]|nr:hypothetical protein GmHk_08G023628 [Glycine max]
MKSQNYRNADCEKGGRSEHPDPETFRSNESKFKEPQRNKPKHIRKTNEAVPKLNSEKSSKFISHAIQSMEEGNEITSGGMGSHR